MMSARIDFDPDSKARLDKMARSFPFIFKRAQGRAAAAARRQIQSILTRGGRPDLGVNKWPKHHAVTTEVHGRHKFFAFKGNHPGIIVSYLKGGAQVVGWPEDLESWMERAQEADTHAFSPGQRRWLHRRGAKDVPQIYSRPERKLIDPYVPHLKRVWPEWIMNNFEKSFEKRFGRKFS